jgi:hypothetical protein
MGNGLIRVILPSFLAAVLTASPALAQDSARERPAPQKTIVLAKVKAKVEAKVEVKTKKSRKAMAKPDHHQASKTQLSVPSADPLAGVPAAERAAVRAALLWSAGEDTTKNGDQIAAAIDTFRERNKSKATGALTTQERDTLLAAARSHEKAFGWTVVTDPATGIRIGVPTKMVPQATLSDQGTRWSSRHGDIQIETFRFKTDDPLNAVFERMKKEPPSRKIEYSTLRPDNFIISGLQGLRKFSVRAFLRDGEVRGFAMQFDQAMEGIVAPVMVAMASAFAPFPGRPTPFAALARLVEYGTGMIASAQGHIVTDRRLAEDCQVIVAAGLGNAEHIATDKKHGLALLRVYGKHHLTPVRFSNVGPVTADLTVVGITDPHIQNGGGNLSELKARLNGASAIELRQSVPVAGLTGAAAVDAEGRVLGMMETRSMVVASAEPAVPPVRLISAEIIRGFLAAHHVTEAPGGNDAKASVVRIICVKK